MHVEQRGEAWAVVDPNGTSERLFLTNAAAWKWIDHNTNEGGPEGDHAGRQDWSIKQHLQAE